ncbi:hypothetical protein Dda_3259 [Drechslerella dactyloides]|uniref:Uncharacterized protein n=1 Tax=Drechslerella dactyloides TaxID=74499 RepID=A0AAD6NK64_DREDA|nr:hypothetical protein Dda_3259 [Drechslerella dactyloides]
MAPSARIAERVMLCRGEGVVDGLRWSQVIDLASMGQENSTGGGEEGVARPTGKKNSVEWEVTYGRFVSSGGVGWSSAAEMGPGLRRHGTRTSTRNTRCRFDEIRASQRRMSKSGGPESEGNIQTRFPEMTDR